MENEPVKPYKDDNIVIPKTVLRNVFIGVLILITGFLVFLYFNSGLTHRKVRKVFLDKYWNKEDKVFDFNVDGVKQIKKDTYWVKVRYRLWENEWVDEKGNGHFRNYQKVGSGEDDVRNYFIESGGLKEKYSFFEYKEDLLFVKWDTGWFVEKKKK